MMRTRRRPVFTLLGVLGSQQIVTAIRKLFHYNEGGCVLDAGF
jgi:hypothetical protein